MRARSAQFAAIVVLLAMPLSAQSIRKESVADETLGWMRIYDFKGVPAPMKVDTRVYSPAQMAVGQMFANWIQATYQPIGGLGDVIRFVSPKLTAYNANTAALPQSYGAYAKIYIDLRYGANRKIEPASNSHLNWTVAANGLYGEPADALNTPERYYFTLPSFSEQGYGDELERAVDLSTHPVLGRFPSYFQRDSATGNRKYILLSKNNRLPFLKVTKGQYLDVVEAAIARAYSSEHAKLIRDNTDSPKRLETFVALLNEKHAKRMAVLKDNRAKYGSRLQEPAEIFTTQPDAMLENYPDVFEGSGASRLKLPVYTIDPAMAELCKADAPQWVVVSWTAQLNDPVIRHLHEAIVNHFNFQYVYDYFFDPDKVKGQPYAPRTGS